MIEAAREHAPDGVFNIRVTHASGMRRQVHRSDRVSGERSPAHRPRSWLINGVKKIRTLDFLNARMTLGQAALKWLLAEPRVVSTLPNIYDDDQLAEFAVASDLPDLSADDMSRIDELARSNFGVEEEQWLQGTMERATAEPMADSPWSHPPRW